MSVTRDTTALRAPATERLVDSILAGTSAGSGRPNPSTSAANPAAMMDSAGITATHIVTAAPRLLDTP